VIDAAGRVLGWWKFAVPRKRSNWDGGDGSSVVSSFLKDKIRRCGRACSTISGECGFHAEAGNQLPVELDRTPVLNRASDPNVLIGRCGLRSQRAWQAEEDDRTAEHEVLGRRTTREAWQYQVSMYYDGLRFRSETGKEVGAAALPSPKVGVLPGSDWYDTLSLIGRVRLEYVGASSHSGEPVHVFAFQNAASDETCRFRQRTAVLLGHKDEERYVPCEGIVVSDEQFNVLGIVLRLSPQFGCVAEWQALARYGLIKLRGSQKPFLLPLSLDLSTRFKNGGCITRRRIGAIIDCCGGIGVADGLTAIR